MYDGNKKWSSKTKFFFSKKLKLDVDDVCRENHKRFKISANFDFCLFLSFQKKKNSFRFIFFISIKGRFFFDRSSTLFFSFHDWIMDVASFICRPVINDSSQNVQPMGSSRSECVGVESGGLRAPPPLPSLSREPPTIVRNFFGAQQQIKVERSLRPSYLISDWLPFTRPCSAEDGRDPPPPSPSSSSSSSSSCPSCLSLFAVCLSAYHSISLSLSCGLIWRSHSLSLSFPLSRLVMRPAGELPTIRAGVQLYFAPHHPGLYETHHEIELIN